MGWHQRLTLALMMVLGLAAVALAQLPPAEEAPPPPYRDEKLGLVFATDGSFHRTGPHVFADPQAGYAVSYDYQLPDDQTPKPSTPFGMRITIDVYDAGLTTIAAGPESPAVEQQFAKSVAALTAAQQLGVYRAVAAQGPADAASIGLAGGLQFRRQQFTLTGKDGKILNSTLYLTGYKNHFLKIRVTMPKRVAATGQAEVDRLLTAFAESLK